MVKKTQRTQIMSVLLKNVKEDRMQHENWKCPKCGNVEFETDVIRTTGNGLSRLFDIQNRKFYRTIVRQLPVQPNSTEVPTKTMNNVLDLFLDLG